MGSKEDSLQLLRAYNDALIGDDEEMAESAARETLEVALPLDQAIAAESIAMRKRRPVLAIRNGEAVLEFNDPGDVPVWKGRLESAKSVLARAIPAVGRIDLKRNPDYQWVGTGWLVHEGYVVTNRHVAEEFAHSDGNKFVFQAGLDGDMEASIDLLQEMGRPEQQVFQIKGIAYIEPRPGLDLAFLAVEQIDGSIARPITLSAGPPAPTPLVATIGYPAFDSRIPEPDLMRQIYGDVYDKKRLAPGALTDFDDRRVLHNCTTLGGNSGSVVLDLTSGEALGLHFSGSFLRTNYAVRGDLVKERLDALLTNRLPARRERPRPARGSANVRVSAPQPSGGARDGAASITIPLIVTVSVGRAEPTAARPSRPSAAASRPGIVRPRDAGDDDPVETEAKAKPEDYLDRKGYLAGFLGSAFSVDLPAIERGRADILTFGNNEHVLNYEHFSVVMNRKRRMCFFSACNIDGERSKSSKRKPWRFDPRIPEELQIMEECYGNPPRFSRGHMTRREDPAWGTPKAIQRGADDSMHVTNATPQMQSFNAPIWLALEDYALQNARRDDQKISVFTGPYLTTNDPEMFGVPIPLKFWKVIAFIHDETGDLCATGYEMSQEENLEQPEFVFANFVSPQLNVSTQVAISTIESRAGISFGRLAEVDPFGQEGPEASSGPLVHPSQIRFI